MKGFIIFVVVGLFLGLTVACSRAVHSKEEAYVQQMESQLAENRSRIRGLLVLYDQFGAATSSLILSYAAGESTPKGSLQAVKELLFAEKAVFDAVFEPCPAPITYGWAFQEFEQQYMRLWGENHKLRNELRHLKRSVEATLIVLSEEGDSRG